MAYRGTVVELPLGPQGLTGTKNLSHVNANFLTEATNITYDQGTIRKEGGATTYNATPISGTPRVIAGWDHTTNALAQRAIVALSNGSVLKDSGGGTFPTTLKSGLSTTRNAFFCEGGKEAAANNRKLFLFTSADVVQVLADDGATMANITTPPADWSGSNQPGFGFVHEGRLMAGGNANDPHRLYISLPTNHEDFTSAGTATLPIFPGEGEKLVGGISYKGLAVLFKYPRGIYTVDTSSVTLANWRTSRITSTVGAVSPHAIIVTENDVVFLDATGALQMLSSALYFGDIGGQSFSAQVQLDPLLRSLVNGALLPRARATYYQAKREIHLAFASTIQGADGPNDQRLVADLNVPGQVRFRLSTRDTCCALWLRKDANGVQRLASGDDAGTMWLLDQDTRSKNGVGYLGKFKTIPTDLSYADPSLAQKYKNLDFLELHYEPLGNWNVTAQISGDDVVLSTFAIPLGATGFLLGTSQLGTGILSASGLKTIRRGLAGRGKRISLSLYNNGPGEDFSIANAFLSFTVGGEE